MKYYPIDEAIARSVKRANSFYEYEENEATARYRALVDEAYEIAGRHKTRVDQMYHVKIDSILDTYARRLADNMNESFRIEASCASWLIAGGGNFPMAKKEKQNQRRDKNFAEWREINDLIHVKLMGVGTGGISSDDPEAVEKLRREVEALEESQEQMKSVNAYFRKYGALDGCPFLGMDMIQRLKADMARGQEFGQGRVPFESYALANNSASIRQKKARVEELLKKAETEYAGWEFPGGRVELNKGANRVQIIFDSKPDEATRDKLKGNGFRWAPSQSSWQRMLNSNGIYAAKRLFPPAG